MESSPSPDPAPFALKSIAMRVHHMDAMRAFYAEAFGFEFEEVPMGPITSWFGRRDGLTLKLVPIRDAVDFESYPLHQPGFLVEDVRRVIELAKKHGGQQEGEVRSARGRVHASVRDPDGNTIELYATEAASPPKS